MPFYKLFRFCHTIRYLTFRQVFYRLYYKFIRVRLHELGELSLREWVASWNFTPWSNLSTKDAEEFTFLGVKGRVFDSIDWQAGKHSKLWLYNLHYLDDLNAYGIDRQPELARRLIQKWRHANPPMAGEGWEPYPLSLRIVNLVKWFACNNFRAADQLYCLGQQADALSQQIEYHILGNHLFSNGKALVFAGTYLDGAFADRWLIQGLRILDREIPEQFLQDGAHFELSPMYHATMLWDVCDLINLARCSGVAALSERLSLWSSILARGLHWLESMLHPDGRIAFFNDAAFGIAPEYSKILEYAKKLGVYPPVLSQQKAIFNAASGYVAVVPCNRVKALLDVASVGPDYQPGHAHADTLSFELSVFGRRLIVNSGTSQYGEDLERHRQRSTAAHSTVEVDGHNSSEVWAGFRVARRARPMVQRFDVQQGSIIIHASHDGYRHLPGRPVHHRQWKFTSDELEIVDKVVGRQTTSVARLYLHPDIKIQQVDGAFVIDIGGRDKAYIELQGADRVTLMASTWHPEFGLSLDNQCIEAVFTKNSLLTRIRWS